MNSRLIKTGALPALQFATNNHAGQAVAERHVVHMECEIGTEADLRSASCSEHVELTMGNKSAT